MASAWPMIARCWGNGDELDWVWLPIPGSQCKIRVPRPAILLWWTEVDGVPRLSLISVKLG